MIKMRPNKTYFVQFNDRISKLVKAELKRDLIYKFSWHWKFGEKRDNSFITFFFIYKMMIMIKSLNRYIKN